MRRFRIYPYTMYSGGAKRLARALTERDRAILVYPDRLYKYKPRHTVINWGCSTAPLWDYSAMVNQPQSVDMASNKLLFFKRAAHTGHLPPYSTDKDEAERWLDGGTIVVARHRLRGHSGAGIHVWETPDGFADSEDAPLYVKYIKKHNEYRIHVAGGNVISLQQKRVRNDVPREQRSYRVRNHARGWVYCVNNVEQPPEGAYTAAIESVAACGLEFAAADVVICSKTGEPFVLEVNTAPGLNADSTLSAYVTYMQSL